MKIYLKKSTFTLNYIFFLGLILFILISNPSFANQNDIYTSWNNATDRPVKDQNIRIFEMDQFRIFYFTDGPNKLVSTDKNKNNIPDYVEDVSKQFYATKHLFCSILGFTPPLLAPYHKNVETIDIYILTRNHLKGALGAAFTDPEQAPLKKKGVLALKVFISMGLDFKNSSTIPHEYFHLIQNGFSKIKNTWYFEGLARWAENILSKKTYYIDPNWNFEKILNSKNVLQHVQTASYDSGKLFWVPTAIKFGKNNKISLPENDILQTLKYSDGTKVLQDTNFIGANLINLFLINLNFADKMIEEKFQFTEWDQANKNHIRNNKYIVDALHNALDAYSKDMKK